MRIIHLSDIHLCSKNHHEFLHHLRDALIRDLMEFHRNKKIDIIVITGDLLDRGGHSLLTLSEYEGEKDPYEIFHNIFLKPIYETLGIGKHSILFIPGNHDVNEKEISIHDETNLIRLINENSLEQILKENFNNYKNSSRIKAFKLFEEEYHKGNNNYNYSHNESTFIYHHQDGKVGFLLINDSWRCKSVSISLRGTPFDPQSDKLYFGYHQLDTALAFLEQEKTDLNICLMHHDLSDFQTFDSYKTRTILENKNIELCLFGHHHNQSTYIPTGPSGTCLFFRARAALNNPDEVDIQYVPGYQIYDMDLKNYVLLEINHRYYSSKNMIFSPDVEAAPPDGRDRNPNTSKGYNLVRKGRTHPTKSLDRNKFFVSP